MSQYIPDLTQAAQESTKIISNDLVEQPDLMMTLRDGKNW